MAVVTFMWYNVTHGADEEGILEDRFDIDALDDDQPSEIDYQIAHLYKHVDAELLYDIWWADPAFFEAKPPAHWLMVAPVAGELYVTALAFGERRSDEVPTYWTTEGERTPGAGISCWWRSAATMTDYFDDPANFEPLGPPRKRSRPGLTEHVPIRFKPWTIARVRILAERDRKPVSSWIRDVVEAEVEKRLPQHAETMTAAGTVEPDEWLRGSPRGTVAAEAESTFAFH